MPSSVAKTLSRLSRERLLILCAKWAKSTYTNPYLTANRSSFEHEDEDYLHEPAPTRSKLVAVYESLQDRNSDLGHLSKKDIIDRIVDGDWRRGLSYDQQAEIDFAALEENDTLLRWSALKLVPLGLDESTTHPAKRRKLSASKTERDRSAYPQVTAEIFVQALKKHISPVVKAHYHIHQIHDLDLAIVRLHITPHTPFAPINYNVPRHKMAASDASRTIYIALPHSCPYIYISIQGPSNPRKPSTRNAGKASTGIDMAALKRIVLEAIPKALSRPQMRWSLESTNLTMKSLKSLNLLRGGGQVGTMGGCLQSLTHPEHSLDSVVSRNSSNEDEDTESNLRQTIERRFGPAKGHNHAKLDRMQVKIEDNAGETYTKGRKRRLSDDHNRSFITIALSGNDVIAGLKKFALHYPEYVDLDRLPSIFTGERDASSMTLRE